MAEAADKAANRQQRAAGTHGEASAASASPWASAGAVQGAAREFTSRAKVQVWEQGRAPHKCSFLWANTKLSWNIHQWIWLLLKVSFPPKAIAVTAMTKTKNAGNLQNWSKLKMLVMHSSFRLCGLYDNFLSFRFHHLSLTTKYDHGMWANAAELLLTKPDIPATYLSIFAVVHTALTRGCSNPPIPTLKHMTATQHLPTAEF